MGRGRKGPQRQQQHASPRAQPKRAPSPTTYQRIRATVTDGVWQAQAMKYTLSTTLIAVFALVIYNGMALRVTKKMSSPIDVRMNLYDWGTFQPQQYLGMRVKQPKSPLFGLMWYVQPERHDRTDIRHRCNQNDGIRYAWEKADSRSFGKQVLRDGDLTLKTDWVNQKESFTVRVLGRHKDSSRRVSLFYYMAIQDDDEMARWNDQLEPYIELGLRTHTGIYGFTKLFGGYQIDMTIWAEWSTVSGTSLPDLNCFYDEELLWNEMVAAEDNGRREARLIQKVKGDRPKYAVVKINLPHEFNVTLNFHTTRGPFVSTADFSSLLAKREKNWDREFDTKFLMNSQNYTAKEKRLGRVALSNMLGSVSYLYGSSYVVGRRYWGERSVEKYGPHSLFTAVPSRSFFPRGFLWDEGFHNLVIQQFDPTLAFEIMCSWLDTMNVDGWIPREQALGLEAEMKVPREYLVQDDSVANPPSWFFAMGSLMHHAPLLHANEGISRRMYPKFSEWFRWLRTSQSGPLENTFRWRGRNGTTARELNPKTMGSGFDDYPRASHPSDEEYHLDLRCWMALASNVMIDFARKFGKPADVQQFEIYLREYSNIDDIIAKHWSDEKKAFFDYGMHSRDVRLEPLPPKPGQKPEDVEWERVVHEAPRLGLVDDAFGYNSLFPFIIMAVPVDTDYYYHILRRISDPEDLWTEFGLRSISKSSPYYRARNTKHDPPYWRGNIWINMNYLVLSALRQYAWESSKYAQLSQRLYNELRANIIRNMAKELDRTGFIWENYNDVTGEGSGCHPFTGWSSLVAVLLREPLFDPSGKKPPVKPADLPPTL